MTSRIKLSQVEVVCSIVECNLNATGAGKALDMSQPYVSGCIRSLEETLGFTVFIRSAKHLVGITPEGQRVVDISFRIMAAVNKIIGVETLRRRYYTKNNIVYSAVNNDWVKIAEFNDDDYDRSKNMAQQFYKRMTVNEPKCIYSDKGVSMKLIQLETICSIFECDLNASAAALSLSIVPVAASNRLRLLEKIVGFDIFTRKGKRFSGVTIGGQIVIDLALKIIEDAKKMESIIPSNSDYEVSGNTVYSFVDNSWMELAKFRGTEFDTAEQMAIEFYKMISGNNPQYFNN